MYKKLCVYGFFLCNHPQHPNDERFVFFPDAIIACPGILTSYDCPIFDDESDFPLSIWSIESCPELQISHKPSGHPSLESDTCGPFTVQPTGSNGTHYTSTLSFIASIEQNGTEITVRNGANGEIVCRAEILGLWWCTSGSAVDVDSISLCACPVHA